MTNVAEFYMEQEKAWLSPYAALTSNTRGRQNPCEPCENRTEYQRDRDRITHSQAFRRLMNKTQVFLAPVGDHYRTRLTHTLEVTQIARTLARALMLNEDLTEAAALGHDLGHTPFGHMGEAALREYCLPGFTHYEQSLRVVDIIERLNLTDEVRDGILNHQGEHLARTPEGRLVKFADRIAYINHDIDDAVRGGILRRDDIPASLQKKLGADHSARISTMVMSVIRQSENSADIAMEPDIYEATMALREFLFARVYRSAPILAEEERAKGLIVRLFEHFVRYPEEMPESYLSLSKTQSPERCAADFISGMTDRHAINLYKTLFVPNTWSGITP